MTMSRLGLLLRRVFLPLGLFLVFVHVTKMDAFTNTLWPSNVNRSESSSGVNSTPIIDHQQRQQPPCFKYLSAGPSRSTFLWISFLTFSIEELKFELDN
jgi:hypothetical protein